ncbi:hypothetical protein [Nodularia sphaerocarpa]|uniref:hypothetical protein n=1 Tax=Nodularia sphaerocarpa TaxID=137816 RepID=UPI001EFBC7A3|nr:hypothetical protein [Nodularia sphaerocarpa]MDB9375893.1 hypothetical protein [Nodularia sphaerocarpa CS-585]MDB9378015.1 hypothetical protein [Nodularia sphaerocarpa CS-585A2]ULP71790.1 hypothetical protein BDGGKGIB_01424 [Nodularia sphaerocarpa UHCC 0038]
MLKFNPPAEPPDFDAKARQLGNNWLAKNKDSKKRPKDYWSKFKIDLADGFGSLCGYSAMFEPVGTVDHYLCCQNHRHLAYEWSNYRFASAWINSSKGTVDDQVLDPFLVEDDWFEILLPSLQLVLTDAIPPQERSRAEFTLQRLHLRDDERVIRQRQQWYQLYLDGEITLTGLEGKAPLIARAIKKQQ